MDAPDLLGALLDILAERLKELNAPPPAPPLTLLGQIPDGRRLYVWGDQAGKLGIATAEAVRNMPDLFGKSFYVQTDSFAFPAVVYIPEYGETARDSVSIGMTRRRVELHAYADPEHGYAVTCAFDAPTRQWYVCGGVRAWKKATKGEEGG